MKIAVDGMGGDYAPQAVVEGAVLAAQEFGADIVLVGDEERLKRELDRLKAPASTISVCHADEVVHMDEAPGMALRKKRFSSIRVAVELVRSGEAQAIVSAGNTGAALAASTMILRPIKGIDRPAIATLLPTRKGHTILIDAGANVDCKAEQLLQFGMMGHVFAKCIFRKSEPIVGLLAIGEEDSKGNELTREAFTMLKQSHLNFFGNIEGQHFFDGVADVVVCDGFIGNVTLKMCEGLAEMYGQSIRAGLTKSVWRRLVALLMRPVLREIRQRVDSSEYGGMPLIGVNGTCIIGHGSSTPKAIKNAIHMAHRLSEEQVTERLREEIELRGDRSGTEGAPGDQLLQQLRGRAPFHLGPRVEVDKVDGINDEMNNDETPPSRVSTS